MAPPACLLDLDHTLAAGIELVHQGLAALQRRPLVDVALVGDFVAVDRRWLTHEERTPDAHRRALALGIEADQSLTQRADDRRMGEQLRTAEPPTLIAREVATGGQVGKAEQA